MTFTQKINYIIHLPIEQKIWLMVLFLGSLLTWFAIKIISMPKLTKLMGHHLGNRRITILADQQQIRDARKMGSLMSMVADNTPWKCECLSQALCIKWLLNRYHIPSMFYLGAFLTKLDNEAKMKAHAWVDVGPFTVIGGPQHRQYTVTASFSTPKLT